MAPPLTYLLVGANDRLLMDFLETNGLLAKVYDVFESAMEMPLAIVVILNAP